LEEGAGGVLMDILRIYEEARSERERRHELEEMLLNAVRSAFRVWDEGIDEALAALGEPPWPDDANREQLRDWLNEQNDLFGILAALLGPRDGAADDPCIDCEAIEQIIAKRKKMFSHQDPATVREPVLSLQSPERFSPRIIDFDRRRGRRPQYDWSIFAAEMARYCRVSIPKDQAELERHMKEWCIENWDGEPADSVIRYWAAPTFRAIRSTVDAS
jgi:hypothetical protein